MKIFFMVVGIILLVSIITYIAGTIYLNIQQNKIKNLLEKEEDK